MKRLVSTEILGFFKKYSNKDKDEYLNITLENGQNLWIGRLHLVFVSEKNDILKSVMAEGIKAGDKLVIPGGEAIRTSRVVNIKKEIMGGIFAPLTFEGTMIVENVWVSCYADVITPHWLVQILMEQTVSKCWLFLIFIIFFFLFSYLRLELNLKW